jgi:hypothetical protein
MGRLVLRPLKLSNGMTIPARTLVAILASATHRDEISYPNHDIKLEEGKELPRDVCIAGVRFPRIRI